MKKLIEKIKKIHLSKTFWFNLVAGAIYASDKLLGSNIIPDKYLVEVTTIGNVILRFLTNKSLDKK